jgi:hypothetical protein
MRLCVLLLLYFGYIIPTNAQTTNIKFADSIVRQPIVKQPAFIVDSLSTQTLFVPVPFGKPNILDTTFTVRLQGAQIIAITLAFTDYPSHQQLQTLNSKRIQNLLTYLPQLEQQLGVQWQVLRQMDGNTKQTAEGMLHGFAISYRQAYTTTTAITEKTLINTLIPESYTAKKIDHPFDYVYAPNTATRTTPILYGRYIRLATPYTQDTLKRREPNDSIVTMATITAYDKGLVTREMIKAWRAKDSVFVLLSPPIINNKRTRTLLPPLQFDSSIYTTLQQLRLPNTSTLVIDVTGSMAAYTAQALYWLHNLDSAERLKFIICFNDGDHKPDATKQLGNTGGIYTMPFNDVTSTKKLVLQAMQNGSGGDFQENVIEALTEAEQVCGSCQATIFLADSYAPVRDLALLHRLSKPVWIIPCGKSDFVRADYITIAAYTKGKIIWPDHTTDEPAALITNGTITIKGKTYIWKNGKATLQTY